MYSGLDGFKYIYLTFLLNYHADLFFPGSCSYHDNAFVTSRALHIVNKLNTSATFGLLEFFFTHQVRIFCKRVLRYLMSVFSTN